METPKLIDKVVYLAAPKRLLQSELYDRAFRFMLAQSKGVMNPMWMFSNNADWQANYQEALKACDVMVIVSDDNLVGKGVYLEYNEFQARFCPVFYYFEDEKFVDENKDSLVMEMTQELVPVIKLEMVDDNDWKDYAIIRY